MTGSPLAAGCFPQSDALASAFRIYSAAHLTLPRYELAGICHANVRGVVDIWGVDAAGHSLVTEQVAVVDISTGEADVTDIAELRAYFEAAEARDKDVNSRIQSLSEDYPGAFEGDIGQTKDLYAEYVSIFQESLDRYPESQHQSVASPFKIFPVTGATTSRQS